MAQPDDPPILSPEAHTRQRDQAASELVRGLLILNGGGAAALLAFLQVIWSSNRVLAKPTIVALVILSIGAVLGLAFHFFRYLTSWYHQNGDPKWRRFRRLYLTLAILSLLAFLAGIGVVAFGAWKALGSNPAVERTAGSPTLTAPAQRER